MSTLMHPPDGNEDGDFLSPSFPPTGDPEPILSKSTPAPPKKRATRRATIPRETSRQLLLSEPTSPTQVGESPPLENTSLAPKAATPSPNLTVSAADIDRLPPLGFLRFERRNRKRGSLLQRLIKKFELEPEDMEKLDRLDQFGRIFVRNALRCVILLIGVILVYTFFIFAEKIRHESDLLGKFAKVMGDNKLMTTLITSATMFGTGAVGTAAVSHVRKKRQEKSKPGKKEKVDSPES